MYCQIKQHAPPLVRVPVNSVWVSFLRMYYPGTSFNALATTPTRSSRHLMMIVYGVDY
ncbi:hypothetical protein UUR5_0010 [Ureaplasma urealyticum serovar 5 str. ATCC 27817]|nr:hypothetical protein UUR5_0010 [Ureaplasma urealyticum serovar 5 str. ATCC 27817]